MILALRNRLLRVAVLLVLIFCCNSAVFDTKVESDLESPPCSLNGDKDEQGICLCDNPWTGNDCEMLKVLPVSFPQGYGMLPNKTTWGGDVIFQDGRYHLYATAMTGGCSLRSWTSHSRIEHAVSDTITGPFRFQDVAVPTFSHNPKLIQLRDETGKLKLALIHIGNGNGPEDAGGNCTPSALDSFQSPLISDSTALHGMKKGRRTIKSADAGGSTIHTADSVDGPWTPLLNHSLGNCNNPAPFLVQNDDNSFTIYIVCNRRGYGELKRADHISGPWTTVSQVTPLSLQSEERFMEEQDIHYEDPALYIDKRGFHIIYHAYIRNEHPPHGHDCTQSTVSKHLFSKNGKTWFQSPGHPYGTQVELTGGDRITIATRERPSLLFQKDSSGQAQMTHLLTGVCSAPNCPKGYG